MRKLDLRVIGFITSFENFTGAKVKDAFFDHNETLVFVVNTGEIGKAIGKNGSNIKHVGFKLKKRFQEECPYAGTSGVGAPLGTPDTGALHMLRLILKKTAYQTFKILMCNRQ